MIEVMSCFRYFLRMNARQEIPNNIQTISLSSFLHVQADSSMGDDTNFIFIEQIGYPYQNSFVAIFGI